MNKEQERALKLLNKNCELLLKQYAKQHHLKKKVDCLWTERSGMICILVLYVSMEKDEPYLDMQTFIKPVWLDEMFWDIMEMPQYKQEPLSAHVVGAFTVHGVLTAKAEHIVPAFSASELERLISAETESFEVRLPEFTEEAYFEKVDSGATMRHGDMMRVLNAIHREDYKRARALLTKRSLSAFSGGTEDFRKQALKWVDNKQNI